jgi:rRNA maturation endonuclease Nob1
MKRAILLPTSFCTTTISTSRPGHLICHACKECHHSEMRLLPDGVFHCPACGSEVLPIVVRALGEVHRV